MSPFNLGQGGDGGAGGAGEACSVLAAAAAREATASMMAEATTTETTNTQDRDSYLYNTTWPSLFGTGRNFIGLEAGTLTVANGCKRQEGRPVPGSGRLIRRWR